MFYRLGFNVDAVALLVSLRSLVIPSFARNSLCHGMLTARSEEADRIVGLKMGADDCLAKAFACANCWSHPFRVAPSTCAVARHAG